MRKREAQYTGFDLFPGDEQQVPRPEKRGFWMTKGRVVRQVLILADRGAAKMRNERRVQWHV